MSAGRPPDYADRLLTRAGLDLAAAPPAEPAVAASETAASAA